jgi:hypothetical protein
MMMHTSLAAHLWSLLSHGQLKSAFCSIAWATVTLLFTTFIILEIIVHQKRLLDFYYMS